MKDSEKSSLINNVIIKQTGEKLFVYVDYALVASKADAWRRIRIEILDNYGLEWGPQAIAKQDPWSSTYYCEVVWKT